MSGGLVVSASNTGYSLDVSQDGSGSLVRFGTSSDNTHFEKDGTLVMSGSAIVYNDVPPVPLINARLGGANQPSLTAIQGNVQALTFAINDYVFGSYEILHEYKEGTDIDMHIHWATQSSDNTDRGVKWEIEYTISNLNETPPLTNTFPASVVVSQEVTIPANTPAKAHVYTDIALIPGANIKIGAYILWRLRRIASTTVPTAPSANPYAIALGAHIQQDTLGSRIEHTK